MANAVQVDLTVITNVSTQAINVLYNTILPEYNTSSIPSDHDGNLLVLPGGRLTIETIRLDAGQIATLKQNGFITYVSGGVAY